MKNWLNKSLKATFALIFELITWSFVRDHIHIYDLDSDFIII